MSYGKTYGTDFSLFGIHEYATLRYEYPHDYNYSNSTNEMFYFRQMFLDTSVAENYMLVNTEAILDAQGETFRRNGES